MAGDAPAELYAPAFNFGEQPQPLLGLAEWINGLAFKNIAFTDDGLPVVKIAEIKGGFSDATKRTNGTYDDRVRLRNGDLLFCWSGQPETSIGTFVWDKGDAWLNQHIFRVLPNKGIDLRFFRFLMMYLQPNFQEIARNKQTTGLGHVTKGDLAMMMVQLPARPEQERIADALQAIQDKLDLSHQMAATLEDIARSLFKSWFVDFDPVHAKAEGRDAALPHDTAAMFPDRLNDEGLPEGWLKQPVEAYLQLAYGKSLPAAAREAGEIPVYGSGGIGGYHNQALVNGPGIIVGRKGSVGTLYWEQGDFFPIDTVFYVKPNDGYSLPFLWEMLRTFPLSDMNADGAVPGLNRSHALQLEFPCPSPPQRHAFDVFSSSIMARMAALKDERAALTSLRDTLLLKLLSGELRVADAETLIAAA